MRCTLSIVHAGLLSDDLHDEMDPVVIEAVRQLPEKEAYMRLYRITHAIDLKMKGGELPREEWTTPEAVSAYNRSYLRGSNFSQIGYFVNFPSTSIYTV